MNKLNDMDKLRVLLPHWIEHNGSHLEEFQKWQELVPTGSHRTAAAKLTEAIKALTQAGAALEEALESLGGPLEHEHQH